jgi:hypothetical protein
MTNLGNFTEKPKVQEDLDDMTIDDIREDGDFNEFEMDEDLFGMNDYPNMEDLY